MNTYLNLSLSLSLSLYIYIYRHLSVLRRATRKSGSNFLIPARTQGSDFHAVAHAYTTTWYLVPNVLNTIQNAIVFCVELQFLPKQAPFFNSTEALAARLFSHKWGLGAPTHMKMPYGD